MICGVISYLHIQIIGLLSVSLLLCITAQTASHRECQKSQKMEFMSCCLEETVEETQNATCCICTIYRCMKKKMAMSSAGKKKPKLLSIYPFGMTFAFESKTKNRVEGRNKATGKGTVSR